MATPLGDKRVTIMMVRGILALVGVWFSIQL